MQAFYQSFTLTVSFYLRQPNRRIQSAPAKTPIFVTCATTSGVRIMLTLSFSINLYSCSIHLDISSIAERRIITSNTMMLLITTRDCHTIIYRLLFFLKIQHEFLMSKICYITLFISMPYERIVLLLPD